MITGKIGPGQGQLVLISPGRPGRASPVTAAGQRRSRWRPARPAPATRSRANRDRTAAAAAPIAASASAHADPAGPGSTGSGCRSRHQPVNTARTGLDPGGEAPQPAPHRLRRPAQQRGDQPVPGTGRLRGQPRPDHRGGVRPADQQHHRQQHMRDAAAGAPRPARHDPQPAVGVADPPAPGMAPPGQHSRASRTRQPARSEPFLDRDQVGLYREHRASERNHTALPQRPGQGHSGRAVAYPDPKIVTVTAPTNADQRDSPTPSASARSTAPEQPYVVIPGGGQHSAPTPPTSLPLTTRRSNRSPDCSLASPQAIQPR